MGDHHQLPPTVMSDQARSEGLALSLFERLVQAGVRPVVLDTQYRMHPAISEFASDCFYAGKIVDGITADDRPAPPGLNWPRPDFPVMFLPSVGAEESDGQSKFNDNEVSLVLDVVRQLLDSGLPSEEVGVITPYTLQVQRLREQLGRSSGVEVQSVDGFQGREKAVIVISTVRSNDDGRIGFLADWYKPSCNIKCPARDVSVCSGQQSVDRSYQRCLHS